MSLRDFLSKKNEEAKAKQPGDAMTPDVPEERSEETTELGSVHVHQSVIASMARLVALKVPGVVEMGGSFVDDLAGILGKGTGDRGIRVEFQEGGVSIDLHVVLEYGVRIPQVAWQIQNEVKQAVEQMTGKPVKRVNVIVQSLRLPEEPPKPPEGDIT